ncbi:MAG: helix-turn-helix transcriptional regulator [Alphaproteobacteria bacterium]|nr:helix-turn-helix transcriptional regulator [Alphaproteobacteria bacterium]
MQNIDFKNLALIAEAVDNICKFFIVPRGLSYFQFKRIYKDESYIVLANNPMFFKDFFENNFVEPSYTIPTYIHQSPIYFWDEFLTPEVHSLTREENQIYHGLTIISRRKKFYDCTTFAMSELHLSPSSYYLQILKDLQMFSELFPKIAKALIEKISQQRIKGVTLKPGLSGRPFFLPQRSSRFKIGEGLNDYITTYEALCLQLLQEGKSYKEIGSILSMSPRTVETHLARLKTRTGLTLRDLALQSFKNFGTGKIDIDLVQVKEEKISEDTKPRKQKEAS